LSRTSLPIDPLLADIGGALGNSSSLVIEAPPGAGKTTRVPPALLAGGLGQGEILVLQPRRLPARLAALRVAEEMGEDVGRTVGYSVRFEDVGSARTRIRFMTEGILLRRLLVDPTLRGVSTVMLDEFHERHLATDLALALLARLQRGARPDLRLVVMSATLESEPVRAFLGGCPGIRSEGRAFPVAIEYPDAPDDRPLAERIASAVRRVHQDGCQGDLLVFLPGAGEIRRAWEQLEPFAQARNLLVLPLHGDLPPAEQQRAVRPAEQTKVILSTNVAETSVTIPGVVAVIDSGLARIASHSPWSGLSRLSVGKISQASAVQRAGRAGRTAPGRALRLYPRHDFESRRPYEIPEIRRLDLSEALLTLAALEVVDASRFEWFETPDAASLEAGSELLRKLDAIDHKGGLTDVGRRMLRFPTHPRLARLLVEGERRGVGEEAAALAALLSEGDISDEARASFGDTRNRPGSAQGADLLERLDRFGQARAARFDRSRLRGLGVNARAADSAERARRQFASALGAARAGERGSRPAGLPTITRGDGDPARSTAEARRPSGPEATDAALAMATLTAFPDRVMRRRSPGASQAILATGGAAEIGPLPPGDLLVAVDAEERTAPTGQKAGRSVVVRLAVAVEPDWLLDLVPAGLAESDSMLWNPDTGRVECVGRLCYGAVVLDESRRAAPPSPAASQILAEAVLASGATTFDILNGSSVSLQVKLEILRAAFPEREVPLLGDEQIRAMLTAACQGLTSLAEFSAVSVEERLRQALSPTVVGMLREETPDHVRLPGGRQATVNYEAGKPPWIESRLQDFFGMSVGPAICRGRVPITLHLLAPNHRAVQVTSDLAGFWQKHYPSIRRELGRRYPRHSWPEDGATATPPAPRPRR
jgi:ATP-dependent helicase HrpB